MLIDVHAHLGDGVVSGTTTTERDLLEAWEAAGIDVAIVQPTMQRVDMESQRSIHDRIARMAKSYPGRVYGMCSLSPRLPPQLYKDEAKRCIEELGFVGIKLNPLTQACGPMGPGGLMVFETCQSLGIPIMIHTGTGLPISLPSLALPRARQFPEVKIVLAHSGMLWLADEAIIVAQECPNVYLETSWTPVHVIKAMLRVLEPRRLLFASDMWDNATTEVAKWKAVPMSDADREWVMWRTAVEVYNLPACSG
jgi:predicted TIM-barrel fold metal-dependent hydrolase